MLQDMFGGVPLVTTTEVGRRERVTRDSLFRFIVSELTASRANLPAALAGRTVRTRDAGRRRRHPREPVHQRRRVQRNTGVSATAYNSCTTVVSGATTGCAAAIAAVTAFSTPASTRWRPTGPRTSPRPTRRRPRTSSSWRTPPSANLGMSIQMRRLHYNQLVPAPWNGFATIADTYNAFNAADAAAQHLPDRASSSATTRASQ